MAALTADTAISRHDRGFRFCQLFIRFVRRRDARANSVGRRSPGAARGAWAARGPGGGRAEMRRKRDSVGAVSADPTGLRRLITDRIGGRETSETVDLTMSRDAIDTDAAVKHRGSGGGGGIFGTQILPACSPAF